MNNNGVNMLSKKAREIIGCEEDDQGLWMPDNDGDFDYITKEHAVGKLTEYVLRIDGQIAIQIDMKAYIVSFPLDELEFRDEDLLTCLSNAVEGMK